MEIDRKQGHAPKTTAVAVTLAGMTQPCVGCTGCQGMCQALIDAITLPEIVLSRRAAG